MEADFLEAFNALKGYLESNVPELGGIITHWEDPFLVHKSRAVMLPDSTAESDGKIVFSVTLWASTVEKNADAIARTQMSVMNKIFRAVYNSAVPFLGAGVTGSDYFDPPPQSPNVGLMQVIIHITAGQLDDCGF